MATQNGEFVYDRPRYPYNFDKDFDEELSLRWQFVRAQVGKPPPFVLLPDLICPPKHPKQAHDDTLTETIYMIRDELKDLNETQQLQLNCRAPCQEGLAKRLGKRWAFLHIGDFAPYPPNFSFHHQEAGGAVLGPLAKHDHLSIATRELQELIRLITEHRFMSFRGWEEKTRDGIKLAEMRIRELEAYMTRQHQAVSKEFELWAEKPRDSAPMIEKPFDNIPDIVTAGCVWQAWFRLERQMLKAEQQLEIKRLVQHWAFCDMLAAMTNGLVEKGEMH